MYQSLSVPFVVWFSVRVSICGVVSPATIAYKGVDILKLYHMMLRANTQSSKGCGLLHHPLPSTIVYSQSQLTSTTIHEAFPENIFIIVKLSIDKKKTQQANKMQKRVSKSLSSHL